MRKRQRGSGSVYLPKGSSVWWAKYYRNGKPFRESTHARNKGQADDFLKNRVAQITVGTFNPNIDRIKIDELAGDVFRDYRINGKRSLPDVEERWRLHLNPFFGGLRAMQLGSDFIGRYVDLRLKEEAKNATINRELALLKRMFSLGMKATPMKVSRIPSIPHLQEDNARIGFLSDAQYSALLRECAKVGIWLRSMMEIGFCYGWRSSEVRLLRVRQVDFSHHMIRLDPGTTKNREGRAVKMTSALELLLTACAHRKLPEDDLFTRDNGKPIRDFRGAWTSVCTKAGVPNLLFHDLRRTAARNLRRAGVAEGVIMKIGGWKTRTVFERYNIINDDDIADAVQKLENRDFGHKLGHSEVAETQVAEAKTIN